MSVKLECGVILGGFELLTKIGKGGMASVWVARGQLRGNSQKRLVAIKAMLPELATEESFRRMFLEEGELIQSIHHEHVVEVLEVGEDKGVLYMVMEWVEGDSLHALIAEANKRRPIPSEMAVRLIADTASGLHAAHELRDASGQLRNIVHCDVSPHNILVGVDGAVKLVDFGVASAMNQLTDQSTKVRGKFAYMSPEQTRAETLDRRSDIFSLGIVLFELTTGYRLFRAETPQQAVELVRSGAIPPPSELRQDYPPRLQEITLKALERDPADRFQSAEEFQQALERYLVDERVMVPSAGVSGLLKRVLGEKLNDRRHTIRAVTLALSDGADTAFMPEDAELNETGDSLTGDPSLDAAHDPSEVGAAQPFSAQITAAAEQKRKAKAAVIALLVLGSAAALVFALGRSEPSLTASPVAATTAVGPAETPKPEPSPPTPSEKTGSATSTDKNTVEKKTNALDLTALPKVDLEEQEAAAEAEAEEEEEGASPTARPRRSEKTLLSRAVAGAGRCGRKGGPKGSARVRLSVTSSGKVVGVSVGAPFGGTEVGACIASRFKGLRLNKGKPRTLVKTITVQ